MLSLTTVRRSCNPRGLPLGKLYIRLFLQLLLLIGLVGMGYKILINSRGAVIKQYKHKTQPVPLEKVSKQPGYIEGFKKDKHALIQGLNVNEDMLQSISNGSLFKVDPYTTSDWRKPLSYFEDTGLVVPSGHDRCPVLTYFPSFTSTEHDLKAEKRMLDIWKMAMWAHGFNPVVTTAKDAKAHPLYKQFVSNHKNDKDPASTTQTYEPLFAWTQRGSGIFMDYHMLPVNRWVGDTRILADMRSRNLTAVGGNLVLPYLQQCNFQDRLIMYLPYKYGLFHGGKDGSNKLIKMITEGASLDDVDNQFLKFNENDAFARYTQDTAAIMFDKDEPVSWSIVADMMEVHLHQAFIKRYKQGGITLVHPMEDQIKSLSYPMYEIAKRVALCRRSDVIGTCPPNHSNLQKALELRKNQQDYFDLGYSLCGNPCARDAPDIYEEEVEQNQRTQKANAKKIILPPARYALKIQYSDVLPLPDMNTLTLVAVPHPFTALALLEKKADVTTRDARQYLLKDPFIRQLTSNYIPGKTVGTAHRLLLCKDAMFQSIYLSNAFWSLWEKLTAASLKEYEQFVNHQFGFPLPKLRNEQELIAATDPDEGSEATLLSVCRERVNYRDTDRDIKGIESWNIADTELWTFLDAWMDVLRERFQKFIEQGKELDNLY